MKFVKCKICGVEMAKIEKCKLASCQRTVDGVQYIFCCGHCADEFKKKQKQQRESVV